LGYFWISITVTNEKGYNISFIASGVAVSTELPETMAEDL